MSEQRTSAAIQAEADGVALPANITTRDHLGAFEVSFSRRSWTTVSVFSALTTMIVGMTALYVVYAPAEPLKWIIASTSGAFAAVFAYAGATLVANRTKLTVTTGRIRVEHGPLPLLPATELATADIAQLTSFRSPKGGWTIACRDKTGRSTPLVLGLIDERQAHALERAIEDRLHIVDDAAGGPVSTTKGPLAAQAHAPGASQASGASAATTTAEAEQQVDEPATVERT